VQNYHQTLVDKTASTKEFNRITHILAHIETVTRLYGRSDEHRVPFDTLNPTVIEWILEGYREAIHIDRHRADMQAIVLQQLECDERREHLIRELVTFVDQHGEYTLPWRSV